MRKRSRVRSIVPLSWRDGLHAAFMGVVRLTRGERVTVRANRHVLTISTRDTIIGAKLLARGFLEPHETSAFQKLVRPGHRCIDIGAHVGYFSVLFGSLAGPTGRVLALEPDPDNSALLRANVELNHLGGVVEVVEAAAGDKPGAGVLGRPADYNMGDNRMYGPSGASPFRERDQRDAVAVKVVAVDDAVRDWARVDVVKMDAQGYEPYVVRGMRAALTRSDDVIMLTEFWPWGMTRVEETPETFCRELADMGFSLWEFYDDGTLAAVDPRELLARRRDKGDITNLMCARAPGVQRLAAAGLVEA